jgi:hypothetical protein
MSPSGRTDIAQTASNQTLLLVGRFHETDHMHGSVNPGPPPKMASQESIALGQLLWIPGSRAEARAPE